MRCACGCCGSGCAVDELPKVVAVQKAAEQVDADLRGDAIGCCANLLRKCCGHARTWRAWAAAALAEEKPRFSRTGASLPKLQGLEWLTRLWFGVYFLCYRKKVPSGFKRKE